MIERAFSIVNDFSALGQARASAPTSAVLPSTSTGGQSDLGVFVLMVGFAAVVALFALARRYQVR
jgi:MYXO-CTERM domain-containing protein